MAEDLLREVTVTEALRAIPAAHREVLNETILRGRTVNEAAAAMGLPVGTVKSRVYYALRTLRLVLAEQARLGTADGGPRGLPEISPGPACRQ